MTSSSDNAEINGLIDHLIESRALGRSPIYVKLLNYFAEQSAQGKTCNEYSVAIDVFEKEADYDVTADSTVRVYIYNLRKKLDTYYTDLGNNEARQLYIPKGEYRLLVRDNVQNENTTSSSINAAARVQPPSKLKFAFLVLTSVVLSSLITAWLLQSKESATDENYTAQQRNFWGGILTDNKPTMIVIGDYFIFAESTDSGEQVRLVREFDVNSAEDLRRKNQQIQKLGQQSEPKLNSNRFDLGLTYLPRGSAYALARIQQLLQTTNKLPRISMMSELSAEDLRANHIIYIGYISGLGVLESYAFANSRFEIGMTYDALIDTETNTQYRSDFIEASNNISFTDFGLISSFSLYGNNRVIALMGTRDAGLMEMSDIAITQSLLDRLKLEGDDNLSYEALFEVDGFNLTNIKSKLLVSDYMYSKSATD